MIKKVLIVCVGNVCRSPMAQLLLENRFKQCNLNTTLDSAGLAALIGQPADPMAVCLLKDKGFDLSYHRAKQLSKAMLFEADLVLTMSSQQEAQIIDKFPTLCGKVHRLGKWDEFDIPDPYRRPKAAFQQALMLIEYGIESWCQRLSNLQ